MVSKLLYASAAIKLKIISHEKIQREARRLILVPQKPGYSGIYFFLLEYLTSGLKYMKFSQDKQCWTQYHLTAVCIAFITYYLTNLTLVPWAHL